MRLDRPYFLHPIVLFLTMVLLTTSLVVASGPSWADNSGDGPKEVKVGIYLNNLYDIDLNNNEYKAKFWLWFLHDDDNYNPIERTEVVNSKQWSSTNEFSDEKEGKQWDVMNVEAVIDEEWDVTHYPFDTQTLHIRIEDIKETSEGIHLIPDTEGTSIDDDLVPDGWKLRDYSISSADNRYDTTFGDPSLEAKTYSDFSRITLALTIQREGGRLFATVFVGFFVATILIIILLGINMSRRVHPITPLAPRVTLCNGSIFATLGSIFVLVNEMPYTTSFTLADSLLFTTSLGTVLAIISSLVTDRLRDSGWGNEIYLANKVVFVTFIILHFGINGSFLVSAF